MKIGDKTFVSLSYKLTVDGQVVDSTSAERPLEFVFGAGYLLPKFEENIKGLEPGAKFQFTLPASDGYGEIISEAVTELPKDVFRIDGNIEDGLLSIGNQIPMSTADGQHLIGTVKSVTGETVTMDFNHPMAGKTLDFSGEIIGVREATEADLTQGMAAAHGGCDCSDCSDDSCGGNGEHAGGCGCGC
ncbi:MAG: peptidylprolyl isomerase [Rikenellaceae bacterium]|nr:peptidylprolyl isomerase [Rikenellaceae bacterium]